jgi:hypothetical protein
VDAGIIACAPLLSAKSCSNLGTQFWLVCNEEAMMGLKGLC